MCQSVIETHAEDGREKTPHGPQTSPWPVLRPRVVTFLAPAASKFVPALRQRLALRMYVFCRLVCAGKHAF